MSAGKARRGKALLVFSALGVFAVIILTVLQFVPWMPGNSDEWDADSGLNKSLIAQAIGEVLGETGAVQEYPTEVEFTIHDQPRKVVLQYAFDSSLQETMERLFRAHRPDYGAFVAMDAASGRVLSMVSYVRGDHGLVGNLVLRATFPSASVFKVVTAAAAIAERNFSANTVIPFNGRNHTLYRSNIFNTKYTRWTRYMTLKDAFALSVNTVFGKIGVHTVGAGELRNYADRFGFNRQIAADVPVQQGRALIPDDDPWALAESASGFTRENTMSPLQGALIAAAIVNDGIMMEPYVIQSVHAVDGAEVYSAQPRVAMHSVDSATANEIRSLMKRTVTRGTSRRAFRGFFRGERASLEVGGKTGSLTGDNPRGKYDWFVGYADGGDGRKIALAALTVHKKLWRVKSSYLARRAIEEYFDNPEAGKSNP